MKVRKNRGLIVLVVRKIFSNSLYKTEQEIEAEREREREREKERERAS
jgi:hypothetical protein